MTPALGYYWEGERERIIYGMKKKPKKSLYYGRPGGLLEVAVSGAAESSNGR